MAGEQSDPPDSGRKRGSPRGLDILSSFGTSECDTGQWTPVHSRQKTCEVNLLQGEDRVRRLKKSHWNLADFLLGTRRGHFVSLTLLFLVLMFSGALCWMATGGVTDMYDTSLLQSLWFSWGMFFDPGTQMGFPADSEAKFKVVAVIFSIFGFTYNLLILGIIVEGARIGLDALHKKRNRIVRNGHSLVLGWSEKTLFLLREMVALSQNKGEKRKIVILAEEEIMVMWSEIHRHFPKASDRRHFICRHGCPFECDDLYKASAVSAHDIIVLGSCQKRESDLDAIRTVVALAALPDQPSGNIIAEVRVPETACVLRSILPCADGLVARGPVNRVLSMMAVDPIVGDCYVSLVSFIHGEEFYLVRREQAPELAGCQTFGEVSRTLTAGICVGVDPPDATTLISPPDDYIIGIEDRLLILAHSEGELTRKGGALGGLLGIKRTVSDLEDSNRMKTQVVRPASGSGAKPKIIIIGWPSDMTERLLMLDEYSSKGTEVHILCQIPAKERISRLESSLTSFVNINLEHHYGSMTSVRKLAKLPLSKAMAIMVLADERWQDNHSAQSDSACLAAVVTIDQLCKGAYPEYPGCESDARIICEIMDPRTERVLSKGGQLAETATFFNSNALETGIFAMASAEFAIFNALLILLQRNDRGNIVSAPLEDYVRPEEMDQIAGSFRALSNRVRERGEVLMGWHIAAAKETVLNPKKTAATDLSAGDQVIVARKLPHRSTAEF